MTETTLKAPRTLSAPQVAERLGYDVRTVQRILARGELRGRRRPGGHWRVQEEDLQSYLSSMSRVSHKD